MDDVSAPKKKPSGHEFRMRRKAKAAAASRPSGGGTLIPGGWQAPSQVGAISSKEAGDIAMELPLYGLPPVTLVRAVNAAIGQLELGMFYSSAYLWDGMLRDDRLAATLEQRIGGLIGARLDVLPSEDDNDTAEDVADDCEKQLSKIMPMHQLYELMRWGLGLSVGIAQVLTTRTVKSTTPTFEVWNLRNARYDWLTRRYYIVTQDQGEIGLELDDPQWIIYEPYGPHGWLHGALIRSLTTPWLIRHWTRSWWARYQEVHGQPIRLGILPADRTPEDEKRFLQQLYTIGHEATIRAPQGTDGNRFDLKLIEATANNWQGFKELLAHCDDSIAISILGQRQSTMGQSGLGAQDKAGDTTLVRILKRDALVSDVLREKLLKPWAEDNYGDEELAPNLHWQVEPEEDMVAKATTIDKLGDAVSKFALAPAFARHVDIRALLDSFGVPLVDAALVPEDDPIADKENGDAMAEKLLTADEQSPGEPAKKDNDRKPGKDNQPEK